VGGGGGSCREMVRWFLRLGGKEELGQKEKEKRLRCASNGLGRVGMYKIEDKRKWGCHKGGEGSAKKWIHRV